jgi:hypothetical protein
LDWADKDGNRIDPATIGLPSDMPRDVRQVITFKDRGDNKTEMTVTECGYTSDQHFELSKRGLEQCLDKMAAIFSPECELPTNLGRPARGALRAAGYYRLEEFRDATAAELLQLHGMGPKALGRLRDALRERGLSLAGE